MFERLYRLLTGIVKELEVPSYIWEDTANSLTYICYAKKRGIETDNIFKIKVVYETLTAHVQIKESHELLPICVGAINEANIQITLSAYYAAGKFNYV